MKKSLSKAGALRAIQQLIVEAKVQAYKVGADNLATFLNDMELLPEFLMGPDDRTQEFLQTLKGVTEFYPRCEHILEGLKQTASDSEPQC